MAVGPWVFYNSFKERSMDGAIDLDTDTFQITLHTSASNAATATLSSYGSLTGEVTEANGYSSSGQALAGVTWAAGASAAERRFDATANIWTASGGAIANVKFAVISSRTGGELVCVSTLSTSQFSISDGNTLTITPSANGIFELNG